jgi:hypothetical protein
LVLLAGLWLLGAGLALVAAVGLWPGGAPAHLSFQQLALFVTAAVAAWFGLALAARRPWSQPLAVAYCLWLALTAGLALLLTWPYGSLTAWLLARTGPLLDADSWTGLIAFGLLLVVAGSVLGGFEFSRPGALRLFRRDARRPWLIARCVAPAWIARVFARIVIAWGWRRTCCSHCCPRSPGWCSTLAQAGGGSRSAARCPTAMPGSMRPSIFCTSRSAAATPILNSTARPAS